MGAWGVLAFDNDDANDWAYELEGKSDLSLIEQALSAIGDDYVEAPDACNALAACEVLARLRGQFGYRNAYTSKVDEWVERHPLQPSSELLSRALSALDRVSGKSSELRELWEEGDGAEWMEAVAGLRRRLTA